MANRYLRGTFTRNAWDFYEGGTAWAYGGYSAPAGTIGFIFKNNGIAQSYIDIFRAEAFSGAATDFVWSVVSPGAQHNDIEPDLYYNSPCQVDLARPPGDMSLYTPPPNFFAPVIRNAVDPANLDVIELANGGPFLTLPPLYGLAVKFNPSAPAVITATIWYQSITDHIPPAT